MIRAEHIVEYRFASDFNWHRYYVTNDWNEASERLEAAKKTVPNVAEIRIRTTLTQTQITEYWRQTE